MRCNQKISQPIIGFILKNSKGLVLLGDNTLNSLKGERIEVVESGEELNGEFIFTMPLLKDGEYSLTASIADGSLKEHTILHWINDALMVRSVCSSISSGLTGVAMQSINMSLEKRL